MTDVKSRGSWMQTYTDKAFYPLAPDPDEIDILDIARALSMQCRYNGHVKFFYSVAEHSVLLAQHVWQDWALRPRSRARLALAALLHDAPEAYIGDMVRPLKNHMPDFCAIDDTLTTMIYAKFNLGLEVIPRAIKEIDTRILLDERAVLKGEPPQEWDVPGEPLGVDIWGLGPRKSERAFLSWFTFLQAQMNGDFE